MATRRHGQIIETPTEARQAEPGPSVLALLTVSTGLAILILGVVWFAFFRTCAGREAERDSLPLIAGEQPDARQPVIRRLAGASFGGLPLRRVGRLRSGALNARAF